LQHFEVDAAELHNVAVPDRLGHAVIGLQDRDDLPATGWAEMGTRWDGETKKGKRGSAAQSISTSSLVSSSEQAQSMHTYTNTQFQELFVYATCAHKTNKQYKDLFVYATYMSELSVSMMHTCLTVAESYSDCTSAPALVTIAVHTWFGISISA
jgi:hypothetical protein